MNLVYLWPPADFNPLTQTPQGSIRSHPIDVGDTPNDAARNLAALLDGIPVTDLIDGDVDGIEVAAPGAVRTIWLGRRFGTDKLTDAIAVFEEAGRGPLSDHLARIYANLPAAGGAVVRTRRQRWFALSADDMVIDPAAAEQPSRAVL